MNNRRVLPKFPLVAACFFAALLCGAMATRVSAGGAGDVRAAEAAFAVSMARRDFAGFSEFVSRDTVFFTHEKVLRGKRAVLDEWKAYFEKPDAPFSWKPDVVEVLDSGDLALSSGPVFNSDGKLVARFTSIWRLERDGRWRVVFDKGNRVCD